MRRFAYLSLVVVLAQLSTGCCLFERIAWRIRSCHGCSPSFGNAGYNGPMMDGSAYGGASFGGGYGAGGDCASCTSGYGAASSPIMYNTAPMVGMPSPPVVGSPTIALPMPAEKK